MTMKTGVYQILCLPTGKRYIGSSAVSFASRFGQHRYKLRHNSHHSRYLQRAWNKYGEAAFRFEIIVLCSADNVLLVEQELTDQLKPQFNVAPLAGNNRGIVRTPRHLVYGERLSALELATKYGFREGTIRQRLRRGVRGDALVAQFKPVVSFVVVDGERMSQQEVADRAGLSLSTICSRIRMGWSAVDLLKRRTRPGRNSRDAGVIDCLTGNSVGLAGVMRTNVRGTYQARLRVDGVPRTICRCKCPAATHFAYVVASDRLAKGLDPRPAG